MPKLLTEALVVLGGSSHLSELEDHKTKHDFVRTALPEQEHGVV